MFAGAWKLKIPVPRLDFLLPRCMECRRGLAMKILSLSLSVCLSNACIVTKRKKDMSRFFIQYERSLSVVLWEEEWLVGSIPSTWNFGSTGPRSHFGHFAVFESRFVGLRDNVRCSSWAHWKARSGLPISVNWTFLLGVTAEALRAKIDPKSAISLQRGQFDQQFQVEGVASHQLFLHGYLGQ